MAFLAPEQTLELNPADAERLGVQHGQRVQVSSDGGSLTATVGLRERMLEGTAFLIEGTATEGANRLAGAGVITVGPAPVEAAEPRAPEREGDAGDGPAAPALIVTKREPVSW